jgi:uncharacterized membrane protein
MTQSAPDARASRGFLGSAVTPLRVLLVSFGALPFVTTLMRGRGLPGSWLFDAWFQLQCHQARVRSFALGGQLLPVCARCTGIYLGLAAGALVVRPRLGMRAALSWVGSAALLMLVDVGTERFGLRAELPLLRALTGFMLGYPIAAALSQGLGPFARATESRPTTGS